IPGLPHAGVDLMVDLEANEATIIEINSQASIRTHLFPMIGEARDVPSKLLNYYFPETTNITRQSMLYFDIKELWDLFRTGKVKEYVYPKLTTNNIIATRFVISGHLQGVNYGNWVRRHARDLGLNGYVKFSENRTVSIVVAGEDLEV